MTLKTTSIFPETKCKKRSRTYLFPKIDSDKNSGTENVTTSSRGTKLQPSQCLPYRVSDPI